MLQIFSSFRPDACNYEHAVVMLHDVLPCTPSSVHTLSWPPTLVRFDARAVRRCKQVQRQAKRGDNVAKALLRDGGRLGRQHVTHLRTRAYPAYLITYKG